MNYNTFLMRFLIVMNFIQSKEKIFFIGSTCLVITKPFHGLKLDF
jgi:hypothetical protein